MAGEPSVDGRMLVRDVVVDHQVAVLVPRRLLIDRAEEREILLMTVVWHAGTDDRAIKDVERCEQRRCPVSLEVVPHGAAATLLEWQAWLSSIEGLDLGLLVRGKHERVLRWVQIQPDDVLELVGELGSLDTLKLRARCGVRP